VLADVVCLDDDPVTDCRIHNFSLPWFHDTTGAGTRPRAACPRQTGPSALPLPDGNS
jgi:hypothetical protein